MSRIPVLPRIAAFIIVLTATSALIGDTVFTIDRAVAPSATSVDQPAQLRSRVHLVYDDQSNAVVRRTYSVWIDALRNGVEFEWTAKNPSALAAQGRRRRRKNRALRLALRSEKSSEHRFRVVLELKNGQVVRSKLVDLLAFLPHVVLPNE